MGPAPKPASQQRRPGRGLASGSLRLPAAGRAGDPPVWSLPRQTKREKVLWTEIWTKPQAVAWEKLNSAETVARYVRLRATSERPKCPAIVLIEVRQLEDRLGLSPLAMLRLRWEVTEDVVVEGESKVIDIRQRMPAVD